MNNSHSFLVHYTVIYYSVTLYFKVSLLQCNYTFKYWVILINFMHLCVVGLLACNHVLLLTIINDVELISLRVIITVHVHVKCVTS